MTDKGAPVATPVAGAASVASSASPKKTKAVLSKKPRAKTSHPKVAEMVNSAVKELKERGGSSLQAIKKYMAGTYKVDTEKQAPFIKRYIKSALASGALVQTKGKGAAGSFKLSASAIKAATVKPKPVKRVAKPKTVAKKAPAAKKPAALKKATSSPSKPKKVAAKKPTSATSEKKKITKGPAAKPPKAKTTTAKPASKSSPKKVKAAAPKKAKPAASKPKKAAPKKAVAIAKK